MFWILAVVTAATALYFVVNKRYNYFTGRGVAQGNPVWFFGDMFSMIFRKVSVPEMVQKLYDISPNSRFCGCYQFTTPCLVVRDPDLIKLVTVKDFDHFVDHSGFILDEDDPLLGKSLLSLTGKKWRSMRATVSPTFTSSKMKHTFSLISQIGEQFVEHFSQKDEAVITAEMKEISSRFTTDAIATVAFGFDCNSLEQPNNEFFLMGREAADLKGVWKTLKFFAFIFFPKICNFFEISIFSKKMRAFFKKLVKENIDSRLKQEIVRPDMINLLLEARKDNPKHEESDTVPDTGFATAAESEVGKTQQSDRIAITDEVITGQAFVFFFAGLDFISGLISFTSHELTANPGVQEKLRQEVDETTRKCRGQLTYEALMGMKYMDMVVSETLRKWPSALALNRICTKPYTIQPTGPNEKPFLVEKDLLISIPMYALHRDPLYFPDPDRFDPERFNEKNKVNIHPYTYMPFGVGPRNCIGSRFALLEAKILFFCLLSKFELVPVEKTQIPLKLSKKVLNMMPENGFWVGLRKRVL